MVSRKPPFLSESQIAGLHDLVGRGLQTVQDFQDPAVSLTFRRRDPDTGWRDVMTITPISVRMDNTQAQEAPANLGGTETRKTGTVKVWAADVAAAPVQPGDRFDWQGHGCKVDVVPPARLGSVTIAFTLLEGN